MATKFEITNLPEFLASVKEAQRTAQDLTEPLSAIRLNWMQGNKTIFSHSDAGPWADLSGGQERRNSKTGRFQSPNGGYKAAKLKKWGFVYPILRASGELERSLTDPTDPVAAFEIVDGRKLLVGSGAVSAQGAPYPKFLRQGTSKMPARDFSKVSELSIARWKVILKTWLVGRVQAQGTSKRA